MNRRPLIDPRLVALLLPVLPLLWTRIRTLLMIGGGLLVLGVRLTLPQTLALLLVAGTVLLMEALAAIPQTTPPRTPAAGGAR
ncbi:hypothetical protein ABZW10_36445 [Kitasatospora sp. NPDC004723]|uniref:hypothetical protein n=1 Tax=Kitasatospora sp. NPDC004723 TaxID=3154288 RepID=UPI0033AD80F0